MAQCSVYRQPWGDMSDSDVCRESECCKMRPTQAMDDSGITQDLSVLSEPSLSTREGKGAHGGGKRRERRRRACQLALPKGARGPSAAVSHRSWVSECQSPLGRAICFPVGLVRRESQFFPQTQEMIHREQPRLEKPFNLPCSK